MYTSSDVCQPKFLGSMLPKEWASGTSNPCLPQKQILMMTGSILLLEESRLLFPLSSKNKMSSDEFRTLTCRGARFYTNSCQHIQPPIWGGWTTNTGFKMTCTGCAPQSCNFWHVGFSALTAGYQVAMCKCTTLFKFSWFLDLQKKTWNYCSLIYISIYINTNATHG